LVRKGGVGLAGLAMGCTGVKAGLAGGLGFSPKPYREWIFFQILFIISNPFELNSNLKVEQLLFTIYIMLRHTSVQMKICNDMNATKQLFL
jgi:hypothetical protein